MVGLLFLFIMNNKNISYHMMASFLQSKIRCTFDPPEKVINLLNISNGMVVADIGCGPGVYSVRIAKKVGSSGLVYAIDANEYMIMRTKRLADSMGLNNIRVIKAAATDLSIIQSESVDVALFIYSLHHMGRKVDAIREALRIIKPNGKVFILDPIWQRFFFHGLKDHEIKQIIEAFSNEAQFNVTRKLWQVLILINKK